MSDCAPVPRYKGKSAPPQPLQLTRREAETLNAAVQRIIRASEAAHLPQLALEKKKTSRR